MSAEKHNKLAHEFIMKVARGTSQSEMMVVIETILFGSMLVLHRRDGLSKGNACEMIEMATHQATDRFAAYSIAGGRVDG